MKYERMHRIFKKFTKFSNWINVGKSTVEKYVQKLNLESSGYFGFEEHPAKSNMLEFRIADNLIKDRNIFPKLTSVLCKMMWSEQLTEEDIAVVETSIEMMYS